MSHHTDKNILLVNPNLMAPPIAPLGLDYLAESLRAHGYNPILCDLTFESDWRSALAASIEDTTPAAIGFSIRNIDDAYFASQDFILETTGKMIKHATAITPAPVVLGGVGFSAAPREVLAYTGAPYGIAGEGEDAFPRLLHILASGGDPATVPGAVFRSGASIIINPPQPCDLSRLPFNRRTFLQNRRYFEEGGQAGVETLRGCPNACIYCVDPLAKGRYVRARPPAHIVAEFKSLLDNGIDTFHLCDCEFNLVPDHVYAMCDAFIRGGLAARVRWYAYGSIIPFDDDMAAAVKRAGCVGLNFGADHADVNMLRRMKRSHSPEDIRRVAASCKKHGLPVMFDTLLGAPGETPDTIAAAINLMRECAPDRVGLSCGVRIYPGTELASIVRAQGLAGNPNLHGSIDGNDSLLKPIFYVDAAVGPDIHALVSSHVKGDPRFFHTNPAEMDGNYNYNDNSVLSNAIKAGARGAYWDILRKSHTV